MFGRRKGYGNGVIGRDANSEISMSEERGETFHNS
jgi:hypothetical protein